MTIAARALARPRHAVVAIPQWLRIGVGAWLATRLALVAALVGAYLISAFTHVPMALDRWDARWYMRIAEQGYSVPINANFFPLLPLMEAGIGRVLAGGHDPSHADLLAAGLAVNAVTTLVAFCALAALVEREAVTRTAATAVMLLAAYPLAMFLAVAYTDGPFLAAALVLFLGVRTRRWWLAAGAGVAAGLLRPVAPLLTIALVAELGIELAMRRADTSDIKTRLLASCSPLLGTGLYAAFLWWRFGDPLLFVHTQTRIWHHVLTWPWQTLGYTIARMAHPGVTIALDLGLVIAFGVLAVAILARFRLAYGLLTAGLVLAVLSSPQPADKDAVQSAGRYMLAAFPGFWMLAHWVAGRPWLEFSLVAAGLPLQATLLVLFVLGGQIY